jgi:microcystin-dependent protein
MAEPFIAEIKMFAGNFAPRGWAFCDGQLLPISSNTALFSLVGTIYGGDGRTTFALPDLRGRVSMHAGNGPGLSQRRVGQRGGTETVTLNVAQMPSHNHSPGCSNDLGDEVLPEGNFVAKPAGADTGEAFASTADKTMGTSPSSNTGGNGAHTNVQPFLVVNYIIALVGTFPSRN